MFATKLQENRKPEILLLDGGFGTTLEDVFYKDVSSSLWSAKPIDEEPDVIVDAHLAFLDAGCDIILTSTYQCAYATFERAGYPQADAVRLMRKAVHLAYEAKTRYLAKGTGTQTRRDIRIALSAGPFGATLSPTQEFDGIYPPPYGPHAYDDTNGDASRPGNAFDNDEDERRAIEALAEFHVERLRVFAGDVETWRMIDCIAFEAVPLTREIWGIRKAMEVIQREFGLDLETDARDGGNTQQKPWWISTLYPDGKFPEMRRANGDGEHVSPVQVMQAMLDGEDPRPDGIGINCTGMAHLPSLLEKMSRAVQSRAHDLQLRKMPSLVVYPNGGDVWNVETRTWVEGEEKAHSWANHLRRIVDSVQEYNVWSGIVVGGCCKTGPKEISALAEEMWR